MVRTPRLTALLACLAALLLLGADALAAGQVVLLDARVSLDAYRAAVDARLGGVLIGTRVLAASGDVRSGDWGRMRPSLAGLAGSVEEQAAVWFAGPDGSYSTVEKGPTGESLRDRAYFPDLLAGRDVVGALVISKSTGKRSLIVASPVIVDGKVVGAVGVSLDAARLAASMHRAIRLPPDVVLYALDSHGQTALHRTDELIFAFPSDVGSPTLADAVKIMLAKPEGVVEYNYGGSGRTALFERSELTGWVLVLGKVHPAAVKP